MKLCGSRSLRLLHQHQLPRLGKITCFDAVEIHTAGERGGIKIYAVGAGALALVDERGYLLTHNVKEAHPMNNRS